MKKVKRILIMRHKVGNSAMDDEIVEECMKEKLTYQKAVQIVTELSEKYPLSTFYVVERSILLQ